MNKKQEQRIWRFLESQYNPPEMGLMTHADTLASIMTVESGARRTGALSPGHMPYSGMETDAAKQRMWLQEWDELLALVYFFDVPYAPRAKSVKDPGYNGMLYVGSIPDLHRMDNHERIGTILDYPPCCITEYGQAVKKRERCRLRRLQSMLATKGPNAREWLWRHRYLTWTTHIPCGPFCSRTHERAMRYAGEVHKRFPALSKRVERGWLERMMFSF